MITNNLIISNKTKNILKTVAISAISGLVLIPASCNAVTEKVYEDYSSEKQIATLAKHLNLDIQDTYLFENKCGRFIHNDGKPIQVIVEPELKQYMPQIKDSLDNMIGLLHDVNNKYSYKFVEKANSTVSTITFESRKIEDPNTIASIDNFETPFFASNLDDKLLISKGSVVIDLEKYKEVDSYMQYYIMKHELAHLLGLKNDVYTVGSLKTKDKHCGNTFIKVEIGSAINMMTPYDVTSVLALYTPQAKNLEDLKDKISFCKDYLINYETKYYNYYTERTKELITKSTDETISFTEFNLDDNFELYFEQFAENNGKKTDYDYEITYQNNEYNLKIFNSKGNLIDECSGDIELQNNVMVLKDVKLEHGITANNILSGKLTGYIQDLALVKDNENVLMYDCFENTLNQGTTKYLSNDLIL